MRDNEGPSRACRRPSAKLLFAAKMKGMAETPEPLRSTVVQGAQATRHHSMAYLRPCPENDRSPASLSAKLNSNTNLTFAFDLDQATRFQLELFFQLAIDCF
jgi:hypothetical protein